MVKVMRSFWRAALCLLLAFAVFAILVSPFAASPPTTLLAKNAPHVLHIAAVVQASLLLGWMSANPLQRLVMEGSTLHSGRDVLALTTARLC